jgi:arylformamidase
VTPGRESLGAAQATRQNEGMTEQRAVLDASVSFLNGGGLAVEDFRLDLPPAIAQAKGKAQQQEIGRLLVTHLGLAMVGEIRITKLEIVREQHKGSRGILAAAAAAGLELPTETTAETQRRPRPEGRLVELSHPIRAGLRTYPGLPEPVIRPFLTREDSRANYAEGTEFAMDVIEMIGNTGTYLDSPFHRYAGGGDLASLTLDRLVDLPAEVFHLQDSSERGIGANVFLDRELRGTAVLLHTGWDRHFETDAYRSNAPYLAEDGVRHLVEQGVVLVGIDSINIDDTEPGSGGARPAHSLLLDAGIQVVEHLTGLEQLPASGATFTATPPLVEGFATFPVRAFARLP